MDCTDIRPGPDPLTFSPTPAYHPHYNTAIEIQAQEEPPQTQPQPDTSQDTVYDDDIQAICSKHLYRSLPRTGLSPRSALRGAKPIHTTLCYATNHPLGTQEEEKDEAQRALEAPIIEHTPTPPRQPDLRHTH